MKFSNVRFGFATNSSSSHSIILLRNGATTTHLDGGKWTEFSFGWEHFRLTDAKEKSNYVAANFYQNLTSLGLNKTEAVKVVSDILGINLPDEGELTNVYVDHQSAIIAPNFPEFWLEFSKFVQRPDVVILGGNDNELPPDGFVPEHSTPLDWVFALQESAAKLKVRHDGSNWIFFNQENGTKVRINFTDEEYTKASAPELVDLKITDWCPFGCKFCYMSSITDGQHARFEDVTKILRQLSKLDVFEVAIGGGEPTLHPKFAAILEYAAKMDIVPNFTTYSTNWCKNEEIVNLVVRQVGGIGISIHNLSDLNKYKKIQDTVRGNGGNFSKPRLVAQHVLGTLDVSDTCHLLDQCMQDNIPILLLGYKTVGFGGNFAPYDYSHLPCLIKLTIDNHRWLDISVDTQVLQQIPDLLKVLKISEVLASKKEGKFSCYIDAVNGKMAPSSYGSNAMPNLPKTYPSIKRLFATF